MAHRIKRNDTDPLVGTLKDGREPVDLTGSAIVFAMKQRGGTKKVSGSAVPDPDQTANKGKLSYAWVNGETDTAGVYDAEFQVTFPSGKVLTFPAGEYAEIIVLADIAA